MLSTPRRLVTVTTVGLLLCFEPLYAQTTKSVASPTPTTKPGLRLIRLRAFARGSLIFEPLPPKTVVIRAKDAMVRLARRELPAGAKSDPPEVLFGGYRLETVSSSKVPAKAPKESASSISVPAQASSKELRRVWIIRFPNVIGERKSGIILRPNLPTAQPVITVPKEVRTDVLVVIDDGTAQVLLRSEFNPETPSASPTTSSKKP